METFLQARSRDAGAPRIIGLPAWIDRVVANVTVRIFGRSYCYDRAVAVDADRDQAHQRCAAGDTVRSSRAADTGTCRQMGRAAQRPRRIGRARNAYLFVGMYTALIAAYRLPSALRRSRENGGLPMTTG